MKEKNYAQLPDRVKAAVIDSILLIAAVYLISEIFAQFETVPQFVRITAFVLIFICYDPIFTSVYGGTIGHSYAGISVKKDRNRNKNISFFAALLRFVFKASLGWISLLTVTGNEKKKAIHDLVAGSVVLEKTT
ncbi:MAG: hypothetical protein Mars2KO_20440 [Maribacter sp.]